MIRTRGTLSNPATMKISLSSNFPPYFFCGLFFASFLSLFANFFFILWSLANDFSEMCLGLRAPSLPSTFSFIFYFCGLWPPSVFLLITGGTREELSAKSCKMCH